MVSPVIICFHSCLHINQRSEHLGKQKTKHRMWMGNCFHLLRDSKSLYCCSEWKSTAPHSPQISKCHRVGMLCFPLTGHRHRKRKWAQFSRMKFTYILVFLGISVKQTAFWGSIKATGSACSLSWKAKEFAVSLLYNQRPYVNHKLYLSTCPFTTEERMQRRAYLKVVCLLIVEVVVVVREGGPADQGGDLWTGKEFERGPEKATFDSHLHPQGHGQQLLALPALLRLPNHGTLFLIFQPQFLGKHSAQTSDLSSSPCWAWGAQGCQVFRTAANVRQQIWGSCVLSAEASGMWPGRAGLSDGGGSASE